MLYLPRLFFKRVNKSNFHLLYSRDFDPSLTNLSLYDVLDMLQRLHINRVKLLCTNSILLMLF